MLLLFRDVMFTFFIHCITVETESPQWCSLSNTFFDLAFDWNAVGCNNWGFETDQILTLTGSCSPANLQWMQQTALGLSSDRPVRLLIWLAGLWFNSESHATRFAYQSCVASHVCVCVCSEQNVDSHRCKGKREKVDINNPVLFFFGSDRNILLLKPKTLVSVKYTFIQYVYSQLKQLL